MSVGGKLPLAASLTALVFVYAAAAAVVAMSIEPWIATRWWATAIGAAAVAPVAYLHVRHVLSPMRSLFRALAGTVASYRDGDFSFGLSWQGGGELGELVDSHNQLGDVLRDQRVALIQRELLLDTMVQHTPVAMLLSDPARRVVYANLAARQLLGEGRKLEGRAIADIAAHAPPTLGPTIASEDDGNSLASSGEEDDEVYLVSRKSFWLNSRRHQLVLVRRLTTELRRQEVEAWKRAIRVISHELNNSLAPIGSLAHSSAELLRRGRLERLPAALGTIEDRARHLEEFIAGYARFAKLPRPNRAVVHWKPFLAGLRAQIDFAYREPDADDAASIDASQLEQCLLNLLKNAHESGSPAGDIEVAVDRAGSWWRLEVRDRGSGMDPDTLARALLPFYSTKRHGTGVGLALAREIAEAHGGTITLDNREGGGLRAVVTVPALAPAAE